MVAIGSKALRLRRRKEYSIAENYLVCEQGGGGGVVYQGNCSKGMGRKSNKKQSGFDDGHGGTDYVSEQPPSSQRDFSYPQASYIRKRIDPETTKYFSEIGNVLESGEIDTDERSIICINALEETTGKEVELANDFVISHIIQVLLEGCGADHLCGFLRSSAKNFAQIATDSCGSHVAETALKSLATHLFDESFYDLIKDTLTLICQAIVQDPVNVMCNCHGSHVLRSLLCLCKGVPLDSEFHTSKSSTALAKRLNLRTERERNNETTNVHEGFPDLLEFLVVEMLKCSRTDIGFLQTDQYSSLVLQTALKVLKGQEQVLFRVIPLILGCNVENAEEDGYIEKKEVQNIREIVKENAFSHLMEIMLEVAPDALYDEIFVKIFKGSLFEDSKHYSANFTIQALICYARNQSQVEAFDEEIGPKVKDLLELGKAGVVASLIATSERLHAYEHKCSKALAAAVSSVNEPPKCIVPRLLLLESYVFSKDKSNWSWTSGSKIHVMGSLILQSLFKYPCEYIQPYITSIISMDNSQVLETAKDGAGARVIEAFLGSSAPDKQKKKLVGKLKGHFGELAMHPSGSFTVEKCFNAGNISLKEAIVSELFAVQKELSKTRQGPLLLRNLDVDGYSRRPEQWLSRQKAKLAFYKDFQVESVETESKSSKRKTPTADNSKKEAQQSDIKKMRQEIDTVLTSSSALTDSKKHKKQRKEGKDHGNEQLPDKKKRKHHQKDDTSKPSKKKMKT
ncbi:pumilio homolog 23 isoform X2 [Silene latifolia]|uniref:pumilio homolog 23 isoform X2 n=1 Tax=Silene latifolia TaxID=37657 RepID=UPI003D784CC3